MQIKLNKNSLIYKGIVLIVILVSLWQLATFSNIMKWDIMDIALPWRYFVSEAISNFTLPLWNPFINTGFPQYGDPSTWYWPSWVLGFLFGYSPFTIQLEFLLHLLFGAMGMIAFAKRLSISNTGSSMMAVGFVLSGFVVSNAQHLGWIIGLAYFPWVLLYSILLVEKSNWKTALIFALLVSLMTSGSYPGMVIVTGYTALGFILANLWLKFKTTEWNKEQFLLIGLSAVTTILLSLVTLISSFDLAKLVNRGSALETGDGLGSVFHGSLPLRALLTFFTPYASTTNMEFWGADLSLINCFIGIIPIVFIAAGIVLWKQMDRRFKVYFLLAILFLMTALAETTPLRRLFYYTLPYMDMFRFSSFIRGYAIFFFLIAFGFSWDYFYEKQAEKKTLLYTVVVFSIISLIFLGISLGNIEAWKFKQLLTQGFGRFDLVSSFMERVYFDILIHVGVLGVLVYLICRKVSPKFILVLFFVEMFLAVQINGRFSIWDKKNPGEIELKFSNFPKGYPLPVLSESIKENNDISGNSIGYLWKNLSIFHKKPSFDGNSPYGLRTADLSASLGLFDTIISQPILFKARHVKGKISEIFSSNENIEIKEFNPNYILFNYKATQGKGNVVVYNQNTNPWWIATVDGNEAKIITVNKTFSAIEVPSGKHLVRFELKPNKIILAFWISAISIILVLLALIFGGLKSIRD